MTSYLVRPATARDARAVDELARRVRRELRLSPAGSGSSPAELLWVVEAGRGEIVGSCGAREVGPGEWELHSLFLAPEWRGFGLGRRLAELALREVERAGGLEIALDVEPACVEAEALAQRLGFTTGSGTAEGARRMVRTLSRPS